MGDTGTEPRAIANATEPLAIANAPGGMRNPPGETTAAPRGTVLAHRRRRVIAGVVAVALVAAALGAWWLGSRSGESAGATAQDTVVTASVQTLSQSISATGTINPKVQSNLRFGSAGTVTRVGVSVGDQVSAGQEVAAIDPTDLQNAVDLAAANVSAASSNLTQVKESSTSTTSQITAARSQLAAAEAKLATARTALAGATLLSPVTGTVATVNIVVGDQVSGGGTSSGGSGSAAGSGGAGAGTTSTAQIVVITTDAWIVSTSVTSADLPALQKGLQAQITPAGTSTRVFGTVSTIGVIASSSSGVAAFPVTIAVTGSPAGLYAGASATVSIIVKEVADALTVPTSAIRTEAGRTVVSRIVAGSPVVTPVQVGMVQGQLTQIVSGLAEGDQIVVTGRSGFPAGGGLSTGTRTRGAAGGGFSGGIGSGGGGAPVPGGAP
ncbi:MAG: biotin/lipoyl-binding protein [Candidatus Phosphoribacter sp.]